MARGRRPLKSLACVQEPCGCIGPSPARDRRGVPECNGNAQHGEKAVFEGRYREGGPTRHAQPLWPAYLPPSRNLYARQLSHATEIHEEPINWDYDKDVLKETQQAGFFWFSVLVVAVLSLAVAWRRLHSRGVNRTA